MITNDVVWKNEIYHYTWISGNNEKDFSPIKLVAAACFDKEGHLLIMSEYSRWRIPGGGPKEGESSVEALKREMFEEVNVELGEIKLMGAFKIVGPDPKSGVQYHLCYYAKISKFLPRKEDPEEGKIHEYKLINPSEVNNFVDWGVTGEAMFEDAIKTFRSGI